MAQYMIVNGVEVDRLYFILNIIWPSILILVVWPLVFLNLSRLAVSYKRDPLKNRRNRVHWVHITGNAILATATFDPSHIYFDTSHFFRHFTLTEFILVSLNLAIYYFFSHVEAYILAEGSRLQVPDWILKVKSRGMIANVIVGNILVAVMLSSNLSFLSGMLHTYLAFQLLLIGSVLVFTVHRVTVLFDAAYAGASTVAGPMRANMRKFRRFAMISSSVMVAFGIYFAATYVPYFFLDPSLKATDDPKWQRTSRRVFATSDVIGVWTTMPALFYFVFVFWIPKPVTPRSNAGSGCGAVWQNAGSRSGKQSATGSSSQGRPNAESGSGKQKNAAGGSGPGRPAASSAPVDLRSAYASALRANGSLPVLNMSMPARSNSVFSNVVPSSMFPITNGTHPPTSINRAMLDMEIASHSRHDGSSSAKELLPRANATSSSLNTHHFPSSSPPLDLDLFARQGSYTKSAEGGDVSSSVQSPSNGSSAGTDRSVQSRSNSSSISTGSVQLHNANYRIV